MIPALSLSREMVIIGFARYKLFVSTWIPALSLSEEDSDHWVCLVQAFRFYLDRTKSVRGITHLFSPLGVGWVAKVIRLTYGAQSQGLQDAYCISLYELQAISCSWVLYINVPYDDNMLYISDHIIPFVVFT